ncbi:MAG: prepilin peptidase [Anaerolineales bacterium]|nr:prepilin peptidase [Anaerolineales bacterium]
MWKILAIILLGWALGLLVNYLADVLPVRRRFVHPICTYCYEDMAWRNYLLWPRKCPHCWQRRPWRAWLVEGLAIAATIWVWLSPPQKLGFWPGLALLVYFAVVMVIDIEYRLILHPVSIFGAVGGLVLGVWLHGSSATFFGGLAGFGIMLGLYYLGALFARWMSRRRGQPLQEVALGFGDVNLAGVLGLILGWPGIAAGLIIAILLGGFFSLFYVIYLLVRRQFRAFIAIPYGPFLILAAFFLLYL